MSFSYVVIRDCNFIERMFLPLPSSAPGPVQVEAGNTEAPSQKHELGMESYEKTGIWTEAIAQEGGASGSVNVVLVHCEEAVSRSTTIVIVYVHDAQALRNPATSFEIRAKEENSTESEFYDTVGDFGEGWL